jgi:uncharacterized protein (TIGR00369 family)
VQPRTHLQIDHAWSGRPVELGPGRATVELVTRPEMRADEHDLVHGGFVFSLADHAAMLAINEPTVVLGAAAVRFVAPVRVGQTCIAQAEVIAHEGKRHTVAVTVRCGETVVVEGELTCFVPRQHILAPRPATTEERS